MPKRAVRSACHEVLGSQVYHDAKSLLTMGLGKDIVAQPCVADLAKMPTCWWPARRGSGKSVRYQHYDSVSALQGRGAAMCACSMIDPRDAGNVGLRRHSHLLCPWCTDT